MSIISCSLIFIRSGKMGNSTAATASSNAFKNTGGATMGSEEIRSVAAKYQSLIGNIKASGRKCLDVENEQLRNDFQTFKRQVGNSTHFGPRPPAPPCIQ